MENQRRTPMLITGGKTRDRKFYYKINPQEDGSSKIGFMADT
jgi:hypothetical protein